MLQTINFRDIIKVTLQRGENMITLYELLSIKKDDFK